MPISYDHIIPWGRSFDEYVAMFSLTEADLGRSILGCGDGPASFNFQMNMRGKQVVSVDPVYQFSKEMLARKVDEVYPVVMEQTRQNADTFVWKHFSSVDELGRSRMSSMKTFLSDYEKGRQEGRYVDAGLPSLPFADGQFDLAVCSHFLFLYSANLDAGFHADSVTELCRVAREVRIFPVVDLNAKPSVHLPMVIKTMEEKGYKLSIETVEYEFQKGGNQMLKISSC